MADQKPMLLVVPAILLGGGLLSCSGMKDDAQTDEIRVASTIEEQPDLVKTLKLKDTTFYLELIANGKLQASQRADLRFQMDGIIHSIAVREGQTVSEGTVLAVLYDAETRITQRRSELDYRRALLDYEDQLLRQGYKLADTVRLDTNTKFIAHLRSGLSSAIITREQAMSDLVKTQLKAPFTGTIANLKARPFNSVSSFEYICTLVDDRSLLVEFKVLDQELPFIRGSRTVEVSAFSKPNATYIGEIVSINPLVDESGMVSVKARLNGQGGLLDGMGVRVISRQTILEQLVVPKEAILDRQGRKVIFTLEDGLAKWNYVEVAHENSTHYAISSGLKVDDEVIYAGNFNLAHDKPVIKID